jgi:DNA polymerase delta subunit 4
VSVQNLALGLDLFFFCLAGVDTTTDILRVFDLTSEYGPCVGISRLARWERAREWGLNPPQEVSL